jgi:hypothetical protein
MDTPIFPDKEKKPTDKNLSAVLGSCVELWHQIEKYVMEKYPDGKAEWNYPGKKYGWSFRIKDKKRAILYFLPGDHHFRVAFVFGQKAMDSVMSSTISQQIKNDLQNATQYAEGRGVRIEVKNKSPLPDIKKCIDIKLAY